MRTLADYGIFTEEQMQQQLKVSLSTLNRWHKESGFPARKVGDTTFYDVEAIREWIKANSGKE